MAPSAPAAARFHQEGLTGLRALAAFWVMAFHFNAIVGPRRITVELGSLHFDVHPLVTIGWVGVDLFFVLSGFLLATHVLERLERGPFDLRGYLEARCRRVFPAYWAQLLLLLAAAFVVGGTWPAWSRYLWLHVPMLHNISPDASFAINAVYWTLPIEFGFYLCLPWVGLRLAEAQALPPIAQAGRLALIALGAIVLTWTYRYFAFEAYRSAPVHSLIWAASQLPGSFDQFTLGAVAAAGLRAWRKAAPRAGARASTPLVLGGLAGVVALMYYLDAIHREFWSGHPALFMWHTFTAACIAALVVGIALGGGFARAVFGNRVVVFLGTVSYSTYLWHYQVANWVHASFPGARSDLGVFALYAVPCVIVVSAASYFCIERPFLRAR